MLGLLTLNLSCAETRSFMALAAVLEIQVAAERSATVMAGRARIVSRGKVLLRSRRADLSSLRQTRRVVVTARAFKPLSRAMLRVTKSDSICG